MLADVLFKAGSFGLIVNGAMAMGLWLLRTRHDPDRSEFWLGVWEGVVFVSLLSGVVALVGVAMGGGS